MKYVVFCICRTIKMLISNWPLKLKFSQFLQAGKTCQLLLTFLPKVTRWSRFLSLFFWKLSRRLSCLERTTVLSDGDTERAREILSSPNAVDFMSSEESEDEAVEGKGPKPRKIRKLAWERSKLKNIKAKLDEAYLEGLNEKQRRTSARISRSGEAISARPRPANGPRWAIRYE